MHRCIVLALAACGAGPVAGDTEISGIISHDETGSRALDLKGFVTIEPGVTVTALPGATISAVTGAQLEVDGTLDVRGEKGNLVTFASKTPGEYWLGMSVTGTLTMRYAKQTGGGIDAN